MSKKQLEEVNLENLDVATGGGKNKTVHCQCNGGQGNNDMMMMMMMTQLFKKDDSSSRRRKR